MYKTGRLDGDSERLEEDTVFKSQGIFSLMHHAMIDRRAI